MMILAILFVSVAVLLGYFALAPGHFLRLASSSLDMEPEARAQFKSTMRWMFGTTAVVCLLIAGYCRYFGQEDPAVVRARQQQQQEKQELVKKYGAGSAFMVDSPNSPLHKKAAR